MPTNTGDTGSNGRITLALLNKTATENAEKIDKILSRLDGYIEASEARIRALEATQARHDERIRQQREDIDDGRRRSNFTDVILAVGTIIGSFIGIQK